MKSVLGLLALLTCVSSHSAFAQGLDPQQQPIKAELISSGEPLSPGKAQIGVRFFVPKSWHIYWKEPGDAGLPTRLSFTAPEGMQFGEIQWPPHVKFVQPGDIVGYGYESDVDLLVPVTFSPDFHAKKIPVEVKARWLACSVSVCIPGSAVFKKEFLFSKGDKGI